LFLVPYLSNQVNIILSLFIGLPTLILFFLNSTYNKSNKITNNNNSSIIDNSISSFNELTSIRVLLLSILVTLIVISNLRLVSSFNMFGQLFISSLCVYFITILLIVYLFLVYLFYLLFFYKQHLSLEYLYSICIYMYSSLYLYMSISIYSFFFIIEVMGVATILLFSSNSLTTPFGPETSSSSNYGIPYSKPTKLAASLFIQFWMSFFSSIMLILFLILSIYFWNTSNFNEINLILTLAKLDYTHIHPLYVSLWDMLFVLAFFIKSGISPFHILKMDLYKGLSLSTVYCYTILYFVGIYIYFLYIIYYLLPHILHNNFYLLEFMLVISSFYLIITLFSSKYLKVFLALSSVLNSVLLLLISLPIV
jgi:hypothetical protein